jgi:hypothetical protein
MNRLLIALTFCILFLINIAQISGNVIGIDFASDALKIALVKPGHPLEIGKPAAVSSPILALLILSLSLHSHQLSIQA